jgi:hypothetical protein
MDAAPTPPAPPTSDSVAAMFQNSSAKLASMPTIHGEVNLLLAELAAHQINNYIGRVLEIAGVPAESKGGHG